jgi:hypothetical protein
MRRIAAAILFFFLASWGLYSQSSGLPPFVSRFTAVSEADGIRLSWHDNPEAEGDYFVYRHTEEIGIATFEAAELLATIPQGVESYLDVPDGDGPHYYAVLTGNIDGSVIEIFVPYRNKTTRGVDVTAGASNDEDAKTLTGIGARIVDNTIAIDYSASGEGDIVIYRSTEPIRSADSLTRAVLVETIAASTSPYIDRPLPGVSYYYGIFYDDALRTGSARFQPGENILSAAVTISDGTAAVVQASPIETSSSTRTRRSTRTTTTSETILTVEPASTETETTTAQDATRSVQDSPDVATATGARVRPLPFLMLSSTVDTGEQLKAGPYDSSDNESLLQPGTEESLARLLGGKNQRSLATRDPTWLEEDESEGPLNILLAELWFDQRWETALEELRYYLQTRRTPTEVQKAYYYMGQCYYFLERYEESFVHFIFAEDSYYPQVQPWLNDLFVLMAAL